MVVSFACACGRRLQVVESLAGGRVRCPGCLQVVTAPAAPPPESEVPMAEEVPPPAPVPPATEQAGTAAPRTARPRHRSIPPAPPPHSRTALTGFSISLASLVLGPLLNQAVIIWLVGGLGGWLVSRMALREIRESQGGLRGRGFAVAGVVIGLGQLVVILLAIVLGILFFAALVKALAGFDPTKFRTGP